MKRLLVIAAIIPVLLVIAAIVLPYIVPTSVYKAQIEKSASEALGREVKLLGEARLSVFPTISARIDGAQVANLDGFEGDLMIDAGALKGSVRLLPLLSRQVEVSKITLSDATIRLERLPDGRANWEFGTAEAEQQGGLDTGIDAARLSNANVYYNDRQSGQQYALTDFSGEARFKALDAPFQSNGAGKINGQAFDYDVRLDTIALLMAQQSSGLKLDLKTDYGDVRYDGRVTLGDLPSLAGAFDVSSETLGTLITLFGSDLPIKANAFDSLRAAGTLSGPATSLVVDFDRLNLQATGLDLDFDGALNMGLEPAIDGSVKVRGDQVERLLKPGNPLALQLPVLGKFDLASDISGDLTAPRLSNLKLKQTSAVLTTDYAGTLSMAGAGEIDGNLSARSSDFRALLSALQIELPPGETLQRFDLSGSTTGTLQKLSLDNAVIEVDDLSAKGTLGADLAGARPRLTANLTMPRLDVTPLLGQSQPDPAAPAQLSQDWNDDPLALDSLKTVDATIDIAAATVIVNKITLQDALLKARLDNGRLSAIFRQDEDKPGFKAFDGNWSGDVVLDASTSRPKLAVEALADSVAAQKMLGDLTGYKGLSGIGDVHLDLTSEGNTIKALINGLDGQFETDLSNGAVQGLNLAKMVRDASNLRGLLAQGNLTPSSFRDAISPEAETDFTSMLAALSFDNGVATITDLNLDNPVVGVVGSGQINLGARTFDIRLVPRIDTTAQGQGDGLQLNNIPIPVRVSGPWTNVSFALDSSAVQAELVARARGQIGSEIGGQIGGDLGTVIGGVIGGRTNPAPTPQSPTQQPATPDTETPAETQPKSIEDELKDRATDAALGAILGRKKPATPTTEPAPEPEPEPAPQP